MTIGATSDASHLRLLLVEDHLPDAELLVEYLADGDQRPSFVRATTLAEARVALLDAALDGVLLDLNLPDSRGLATLEQVRGQRGDLPCIVIAGGIDESFRAGARRCGAVEVIDKSDAGSPFFCAAVFYVIAQYKERQRQHQIATLVASCPDAMLVTSHQGTVRYVNEAAIELFGRSRDDLLGEVLHFSVASGTAQEVCVARPREDPRIGEVRLAALDWDGEPAQLVTIRDVTARKQAEHLRVRGERLEMEARVKSEFLERLEQANSRLEGQNHALARAKQEAEVLVREVHHRVKNNLQIISSLLHLQADRLSDPDAISLFGKTCARVDSIAKAHEQIYQAQELTRIDFDAYVRAIVDNLIAASGDLDDRVSAAYEIADVAMPIDVAIPCGMIVNELVTNALKHAFPGGRPGIVRVELAQLPDTAELELTVADDGVGVSRARARQGSFGLELVETFAEQLGAVCETRDAGGLRTSVRFRLPDEGVLRMTRCG